MNKKKELKYLWINELENKVFKEQKQERKSTETRGNKVKQQGKRSINRTSRGIGNGWGIGKRNGNRGEEREQAEEQRKQERRNYLDEQHGRSRAEDGKTNKERKNELKIKTEMRNWKGKPRWKVIWIYPICYRLPPTEKFGIVNYFSILGQCTESGLIGTTENKFFNYLKIKLDVITTKYYTYIYYI